MSFNFRRNLSSVRPPSAESRDPELSVSLVPTSSLTTPKSTDIFSKTLSRTTKRKPKNSSIPPTMKIRQTLVDSRNLESLAQPIYPRHQNKNRRFLNPSSQSVETKKESLALLLFIPSSFSFFPTFSLFSVPFLLTIACFLSIYCLYLLLYFLSPVCSETKKDDSKLDRRTLSRSHSLLVVAYKDFH